MGGADSIKEYAVPVTTAAADDDDAVGGAFAADVWVGKEGARGEATGGWGWGVGKDAD